MFQAGLNKVDFFSLNLNFVIIFHNKNMNFYFLLHIFKPFLWLIIWTQLFFFLYS